MLNINSNIIGVNRYRVGLSPTPLGTISSQTTFANLNDWAVNGSTFSTTGGEINLTGGTASFADRILFNVSGNPHRFTCLEKWKIRVKVRTPATVNGAATYGIGIGVDSVYGIGAADDFSNIFRWIWDTGNNGQIVRYVQKGFTNQVYSGAGNALVPVGNTVYTLEVERNKTDITYRIFNASNVQVLTYTFTFDLSATYIQSHNTGRFGIWNFGGTNVRILEVTISSLANKNVNYITVGDSNMSGLWAVTTGGRYVEQAMLTANKSYEILAGIGDRTADVLLRVPEMLALNPQNAFINIGSNDIANAVPTLTWQGNYDSIISSLQTALITTKLGSCIARNVDVSANQAYVAGKVNQQIDQYTLTKNIGNTQLQVLYGGGVDGIHMNLVGNTANATLLGTIL